MADCSAIISDAIQVDDKQQTIDLGCKEEEYRYGRAMVNQAAKEGNVDPLSDDVDCNKLIEEARGETMESGDDDLDDEEKEEIRPNMALLQGYEIEEVQEEQQITFKPPTARRTPRGTSRLPEDPELKESRKEFHARNDHFSPNQKEREIPDRR
jgi:hypothetical protein